MSIRATESVLLTLSVFKGQIEDIYQSIVDGAVKSASEELPKKGPSKLIQKVPVPLTFINVGTDINHPKWVVEEFIRLKSLVASIDETIGNIIRVSTKDGIE